LEPVLEENAAGEPPGGNGEAALVEGHEPLGGATRTRHWGPSTPQRW
jgi:hypothetical protein